MHPFMPRRQISIANRCGSLTSLETVGSSCLFKPSFLSYPTASRFHLTSTTYTSPAIRPNFCRSTTRNVICSNNTVCLIAPPAYSHQYTLEGASILHLLSEAKHPILSTNVTTGRRRRGLLLEIPTRYSLIKVTIKLRLGLSSAVY